MKKIYMGAAGLGIAAFFALNGARLAATLEAVPGGQAAKAELGEKVPGTF